MRLNTLYIYGFGKLKDLKISLHTGLNIIEGNNEAGKSTIMAFISAVLFGFESRRLGHLRYEPLQGGKFGGFIELIGEDNQIYKVERIYHQRMAGDVRVFLPNGDILGEEFLPNLIGKINDKVFKQIFSFGINELQQIDSLQDDQINDFILHSGTGVVNQILKMKQNLDQKEQQLFKSNGRKPVINILISQMDEISQKITQKKLERDTHHSYSQQIKAIDQKISRNENNLTHIKQELDWYEKGLHYFNQYARIKEIEQRLLDYSAISFFPENGIERYEHFAEQRLDLETERQQALEKSQKIEQDLLQINVDQSILEQAEQIEYLKESLSLYQNYKQSNVGLSEELEHLKQSIDNQFMHLGADFTEEKILAIEYTIQDKHNLHSLTEQIQKKKLELYEKEREIDVTNKQITQIDNKIENNESKKDEDVELNIEQDYKTVKDIWQKIKESIWKKEQLTEQRENYELQLNDYKVSQSKQNKFLTVTNILFFLLSGMIFIMTDSLVGTVLLGISILLFILLVKRYLINSPHITTIKTNIQMTNNIISEIEQSIQAENKKLDQIVMFYGYNFWEPNIIQKLEQLNTISYKKKQERIYLSTKKNDAIKEKSQLFENLNELKHECKEIQNEIDQLKIELEKWLTNHQLPNTLPLAILTETLTIIQTIKELITKRQHLVKNIKKNVLAMEEYESSLKQVIERIGISFKINIDENVIILSNQLKNNLELRVKRTYLLKELQEIKDKIVLLDKKTNQIKSKQEDLLRYAKAIEQEDFYKKSKQFTEYQALSDEKNHLLYSIRSSCLSETDYDNLLVDLSNKSLTDWKDGVSLYQERLNTVNQLLKQLIEQKGEIQNRIKELEKDQSLVELTQDYENLRTEFKRKITEWTTARIAKHLLNKTIQLYEMEKQPMVIQNATDYFKHLTGGRYVKIFTPIGTKEIEVIDAYGQKFAPQYLSRGTIEQLFLAMRFALVDEFSIKINLPIIIDDIFVNYDQNRISNAFTTIDQLTGKHQILFFTCHSSIADKYTQIVGKEINHILLED